MNNSEVELQDSEYLDVVILMPTYNHEFFIEQAIKGVVSQQANYNYKLIILDDCSTDNTYNVCKHYSIIFPDKIIFKKNETNLGAYKSGEKLREFGFSYNAKYMAICEGDDYWTDPLKLQKQVDFLEANEDYSICFHEATVLYEDGKEILYNNIGVNKTFNFLDLVHNNFMATASCVFRVYEHHNPMPVWFKGFAGNDWGLKLLNASKGKIYYMKDCMSVYRVHSGGIWSSQSHEEMYENGIKVLDSLNAAFNYQYNEAFEQGKKLRFQSFFPTPAIIAKQEKYSGIKSRIKYYLSKILSH